MIQIREVLQTINRFRNGIILSNDEVDERVEVYLKSQPPGRFFYSELVKRLNIHLELVIHSCMRLEKRGMIKGLKNET